MTTRREIVRAGAGLAAIIAAGKAPAAFVRSMLGMRGAMMGGKRLPYDAEVEYLYSDGSEVRYIDTCYVLKAYDRVEVEYQLLGTSGWPEVYGARSDSYRYRCFALFAGFWTGSIAYYCRTGYEQTTGVSSMTKTLAVAEGKNITLYRDGVPVGRMTSSGVIEDCIGTCFLFSINRATVADGKIPDNTTCNLRIFSFKVVSGGKTVVDLVPVRRTLDGVSVGEMYDRVTGTFADHYGTFTFGPDSSNN